MLCGAQEVHPKVSPLALLGIAWRCFALSNFACWHAMQVTTQQPALAF